MRKGNAGKMWVLAAVAILGFSPSWCRASETVESVLDLMPVWSGFPVGFALMTSGNYQFAAFYDAGRRMIVGARSLGSAQWDFVVLPSQLGWDSHNFISMAVDQTGCIHLSGNMHVTPLIYFRTRRPYDIRSFEQIPQMVGERESRCTYPKFMTGPGGELIFSYRDGHSGAGDDIYNVYDPQTKAWRRLLDQPLLSGQGRMNAYPIGPTLGPDGYYHLCWVWRDTIDASTNHDLSYARSRDLIHWETSAGQPVTLPMTISNTEIVDPVPVQGGLMNAGVTLGFDAQKRPIIGYIKFDKRGNTQLYDARLENGAWQTHQISNWDYRWDFRGGGTVVMEIGSSPVHVTPKGLVQSFSHVKYHTGLWVLDETTLQPKELLPVPPALPELSKVESTYPGMHVRQAPQVLFGKNPEPGVRYVLRWETLDTNRDRPLTGRLPPPSTLRLLKLRADSGSGN
jgi:hypothetical protein